MGCVAEHACVLARRCLDGCRRGGAKIVLGIDDRRLGPDRTLGNDFPAQRRRCYQEHNEDAAAH
jgi:hypothetical protein